MSDGVSKAPWWAWGYVVTLPLSLLTLVTPWFHAVPPKLNVWGDGQQASYSAWTNPEIGIIAPIFLTMVGIQWLRARRGWGSPPAPGDWRGSGRAISATMGGGRVLPSAYAKSRPVSVPLFPFRTGSMISIGVAAASLALLGLNRVVFSPAYSVINTTTYDFQHGKMIVHPALGCWCYLISVALLLVTGAVGALVSEGDTLDPELAPPIRELGLRPLNDDDPVADGS